jgi:hypothetical protein
MEAAGIAPARHFNQDRALVCNGLGLFQQIATDSMNSWLNHVGRSRLS